MRSQGNVVSRPSVVLDVVVSHDEIRNHTVEELVEKISNMVRIQLEAAKRHVDDTPPIELTRAMREANQFTKKDR